MADLARYKQENPETAFEASDWRLRPVAFIFAGTLVFLVIAPLVLIEAFPKALPDVARTLRITPPGPRLQTDPQRDLEQFRTEESERLSAYYWVDKQKGIVHIPVEQAMKQLAAKGIPGFPEASK